MLKTLLRYYLLNVKVTRSRIRRAAYRLCSEAVIRILDDDEWERFTRDWYAKRQWPSEFYASDVLFEWEKNAIRFFPKPPSNLLVLAAGRGRELRALIKMGYSVFGIEMDQDCINYIQATTPPDNFLGVMKASFLDIKNAKIRLPKIPVSGIIIGWSALVHLPSKEAIVDLVQIISNTYPEVPLLLSGSVPHRPRFLRSYLSLNRESRITNESDFCRWIDPWYGPCGSLKTEVLESIFGMFGYEILYRYSKDEYPHWVIR